METLPTEIAVAILERLPIVDVLAYGATCTRAREVAICDHLWSTRAHVNFSDADVHGYAEYLNSHIDGAVATCASIMDRMRAQLAGASERHLRTWTHPFVPAFARAIATATCTARVSRLALVVPSIRVDDAREVRWFREAICDAVCALLLRGRVGTVIALFATFGDMCAPFVEFGSAHVHAAIWTDQMYRDAMLALGTGAYTRIATAYAKYYATALEHVRPVQARFDIIAHMCHARNCAEIYARGGDADYTCDISDAVSAYNANILIAAIDSVCGHIQRRDHMLGNLSGAAASPDEPLPPSNWYSA